MSDLGDHKRSGVAVPVPRPAPRPAPLSPRPSRGTARRGAIVRAGAGVGASDETAWLLDAGAVNVAHADAFVENELATREMEE